MKFKKNQSVLTNELDLTSTGGPFIPKDTKATVVIRRRDGTLWVNIFGFGWRHVYPESLRPI